MAYLLDIPKFRCRCGKPATVELHNRQNAMNGRYCRKCGERELAKLEQREEAHR